MGINKKTYTMASIGFGGMAMIHFKESKNIARLNFKGIYDIDSERCKCASDAGLHIYSSREELLADDDVDLVLIAVPNHLHKEFAVEALKAGKHVICEKPATISSAEMIEIMTVAKQCGKIFAVDQNRRVNRDFIAMKRAVESGAIGEVYEIQSRVEGSRGVPEGWRTDPKQGGGMMLDWGVHLIDQILYMYKGCKVISVQCNLYSLNYPDVDDSFHLVIKLDNGVRAYIEVATNNFITLPRWYVLGTDGSLQIDDWDGTGKIVRCIDRENKWSAEIQPNKVGASKTMAPRSEKSAEIIKINSPEDVIDDIKPVYYQLLDAMDGTAELKITNEQVLRVIEVMEAAFESNGNTIETNI